MSTKEIVSVIMNAHNAERYLAEAIESVLAQTYTNWEIILWDNKSSDSTGKIVSEFTDDRINYYYSDSYSTLGLARNRALGKASGSFLAFLDCDDLWLPEKLEKQVRLFHQDEEIGLVYSDCIYFNSRGHETNLFSLKRPYRGRRYPEMLNEYCISMESVILSKKCLESLEIWFDPAFEVIEEYELFARVAEKWKVDYVEEPLSKWRMHDASWTWQKPRLFIDEKYLMLKKIEDNNGVNERFIDEINLFKQKITFEEIIYFWKNKEGKRARALLLETKKSIKNILLFFATFLPFGFVDFFKSKFSRGIRP